MHMDGGWHPGVSGGCCRGAWMAAQRNGDSGTSPATIGAGSAAATLAQSPLNSMRKLLLLSAALVVLCAQSWAWGREGHQIIAAIAEDHLDETTKVMIQSLIGNNHLYSIAPWADDVRRERPETKTWHYVNIPLGGEYNPVRDCAAPKSCVVEEIDHFLKVLTDRQASRDQRAEALKFLVHFVGDIHQPMHAVKEEAGGNGIHVSFLESTRCGPYECSLHGAWDTSMILHTGMNRDEYVQHEEELIKADRLEKHMVGTPVQWANESVHLAQAAWVADGTSLDDNYYQKEIKIVNTQMALAGLRLANLLNDTIGKLTPRDFAVASAQTAVSPANPLDAGGSSSDVSVWVNTTSKVFHCPATRWYGKTKNGEYMSEAEAVKKGYRPVGDKMCQ
jgi:hypothetical protein